MDGKYKKKCYEYAEQLYKMEPWLKFSDQDWINIDQVDEEREEDPSNPFALPDSSCFCSILGNAKNTYGISLYWGEKGLNSLLLMSHGSEDQNDSEYLNIMGNQECINLYYDTVQTIKEQPFAECLEPEYADKKGKVPYFVQFSQGYFPFMPKENDFKKLCKVLKNLIDILEEEKEENFLDTMNSDTEIISAMVEEDESPFLTSLPRPVSSMYMQSLPPLTDKEVSDLTKGKKKSESCMILDSTYTMPAMDDTGTAIIPRLILCMDENGMIIDIAMMSPKDNLKQSILKVLHHFIEQKGIPHYYACRKLDLLITLAPFIEACDPEMVDDMEWEQIDDMFTEIQNQMNAMAPENMPS